MNYSRTKGMAELLVLAADGVKGVRTCALRPSVMMSDRIMRETKNLWSHRWFGRLGMHFGVRRAGRFPFDYSCIYNCAWAHCAALAKLLDGDKEDEVGGEAFFLTQDRPVPSQDVVRLMCAAVDGRGWRGPRIYFPLFVIRTAAFFLEIAVWLLFLVTLGWHRTSFDNPLNTAGFKVVVHLPMYVSSEKARRVLGYRPEKMTLAECTVQAAVEYFETEGVDYDVDDIRARVAQVKMTSMF